MSFEKYISKSRLRHRLEGIPRGKYRLAIAIPAFAEMESLPRTLESISRNSQELLDEAMIVVVVNNPPPSSANPARLEENTLMLRQLRNAQFPCQDRLRLSWIDASSPGMEIDPKEGVGAARRIGMDAVLGSLDFEGASPLILSLDADTGVEENYIGSVKSFFDDNPRIIGASIAFAHQDGTTQREDEAITRYELFMRYYVEGLRIAGSPYAYHVLGSAMAFRARDYVRAGGMRKRNGGEDFYFMQALRKIGEVGEIKGTTVHPSSRPSDRVPFGTGPRISRIMDGSKELLFYNPEIFIMLRGLLSMVAAGENPYSLVEPGKIAPVLEEFLVANRFFHEWDKILDNTPHEIQKVRWAFHTWFDAFRTLKFVHYCEGRYPGMGSIGAYSRLFEFSGNPLPDQVLASEKTLLGFMRKI